NDIAFVTGRDEFYVTSLGSNAVFHATLNPDGTLASVGGAGTAQYIDLHPLEGNLARTPLGLAVGASHADLAFVANDTTNNVSILDLRSQLSVREVNALPDQRRNNIPAAEQARSDAHFLFVTGVGRWGYHAQGWSSCEGCHPDGLTDGVTWF